MFRRKNTLHLLSRSILFTLTFFIILTSAEYIQCTDSHPDEFLDTLVIHKIRASKPLQAQSLMAINNSTLITIPLIRHQSWETPYPDLGTSKEVSNTVLRC